MTKRRVLIAIILLLAAGAFAGRQWLVPAVQRTTAPNTIEQRLAQYGPAARQRLATDFAKAGVAYPPARLTMVGIKGSKTLELWVAGKTGPWRRLRSYPILAASGTLGPKLREGDLQVPEGLYRIESLNPNSLYHLSLRVSYPNDFDRAKGKLDGRAKLGGDIMIHGSNCSIGCLAMGDEASEDLFVLAADTGLDNISVILTPVDFRVRDLPADMPKAPPWTPELYAAIKKALLPLRESPATATAPATSGIKMMQKG